MTQKLPMLGILLNGLEYEFNFFTMRVSLLGNITKKGSFFLRIIPLEVQFRLSVCFEVSSGSNVLMCDN